MDDAVKLRVNYTWHTVKVRLQASHSQHYFTWLSEIVTKDSIVDHAKQRQTQLGQDLLAELRHSQGRNCAGQTIDFMYGLTCSDYQ